MKLYAAAQDIQGSVSQHSSWSVAAAEILVDAMHGIVCERSTEEAAGDAADGMWELLKAEGGPD